MPSVDYSTRFLRQLRKQPLEIQNLADAKDHLFRLNPFDSRLGTHKLHGKDRENWAYWVTRKIRIKFVFISDQVLYLEIGSHNEVY